MSLLLDALKKAADEKNTSATDNQLLSDTELDTPVHSNSDNSNTSLELELDDAFPEVDEKAIRKSQNLHVEKDKEQSKISNAPQENPDKDEVTLALEETPEEIESNNDINHISIKNAPPELSATEQEKQIRQKQISENIRNEQALSALINKSNQFTRKHKRKRAIIIAVPTIILLVSTALYFFIEIQLSSQDLYITDNVNNHEISRDAADHSETIKQATQPVQATTIKTVPVQHIETRSINKIKIPPARNKPAVKHNAIIKQTPALPFEKNKISIIRSNKIDPLHTLLNDAYIAFNKQDYRQAEDLYNQALNQEETNRDALLGLAAIGSKQKRFEFARQKYQYLLKLNPRDSIAIAGMSNIQDRVNSQLNESQLKFMLKQQPDSPHLYFALGSHYSALNKWPEAQSAFFSAWSADNINADYAYNLAVSLDHLSKQKQAVDFYQLSLKLQKSTNGNFSSADVHRRISSLQEHLK